MSRTKKTSTILKLKDTLGANLSRFNCREEKDPQYSPMASFQTVGLEKAWVKQSQKIGQSITV